MARRKTAYARRTETLRKKALELSTLCGVPVALVCAPADAGAGAGTRVVWESEASVLDRYRGACAAKTRARHTHRSYLEAELGKEKAKLARVRPGALADWDDALNDMTLDEAREVLQTVDAALRAAGDRMAALGLPAEGQAELPLAPGDGDDASSDDATGVPQQLGPENVEHAGFQMQMVPCQGGDNDVGMLEQLLWDDRYGLERVGGNYDVGAIEDVGAIDAGYGDNNADCGWPDLTMCYTDDGSTGAVLPAGYYYPEFVDGTLAPEHYSSQAATGGDYIDTLPLDYPMGTDQNFTNLDNSYTLQWQAEEFQRSDTNCSMDENYTYLDNSYTAQWRAEEFQRSDTNSSMDENYTYLDNSYTMQWQAEAFQRSDTSTGHYQHQHSDPETPS
uniref:Uncharacterized protein n=1 Tax=Avena sativa TaxID=4498 RepID=A0ACD6A3F5_AVESA